MRKTSLLRLVICIVHCCTVGSLLAMLSRGVLRLRAVSRALSIGAPPPFAQRLDKDWILHHAAPPEILGQWQAISRERTSQLREQLIQDHAARVHNEELKKQHEEFRKQLPAEQLNANPSAANLCVVGCWTVGRAVAAGIALDFFFHGQYIPSALALLIAAIQMSADSESHELKVLEEKLERSLREMSTLLSDTRREQLEHWERVHSVLAGSNQSVATTKMLLEKVASVYPEIDREYLQKTLCAAAGEDAYIMRRILELHRSIAASNARPGREMS